MCGAGEFDMPTDGEGAYKHRGKEWMVPEVAVLAYEACQRVGGCRATESLSHWKKIKPTQPRRKHAA
jgi:hypothetical protein